MKRAPTHDEKKRELYSDDPAHRAAHDSPPPSLGAEVALHVLALARSLMSLGYRISLRPKAGLSWEVEAVTTSFIEHHEQVTISPGTPPEEIAAMSGWIDRRLRMKLEGT